MQLTRRTLLTSAAASVGLGACGARLDTFPFDGDTVPQGGPDDLRATFASVGCFHLQWRDLGLLTDPFFTHVSLARAGFGEVVPDPAASASWWDQLGDVRAVLVGHGHYDHCLDLPVVAPHLHPDAVVCAGATVAHTFAPLAVPRAFRVVNDQLASPTRPGRWIELADGRMRVLPIASGHPSNVRGIHVFRGALTEDRTTPPTRASHYQEGITVAWLVDLLDADGAVARRVYVQTSSTGPPAGLAPQATFDAHPVDLAVLAMDCATFRARGEPSILDHIRPRRVLFCHWGDFFRAKDQPPREGVKVDLPWLRDTLRAEPGGERFLFPGWGRHFAFQGAG
ncbi:MAG: MBL fold metallo-hydrolase [Alphaproteobacteria bacterium]|nr:MBL fold metallo-hydrolase [Alphaproteobacteria bacterium]